MTEAPAKKPKKLFLSASRIETLLTCSQKYAARYLWKLPDPGNDGSRRGSTCHEVLELLQKSRHRKLYSAAIHADTCQEVPALWRFVQRVAQRYSVADPVNLQMIDGFIMVGLKNAFFGPPGTKLLEIEREFTVEVNQGGKRYAVRGFVDRVAHVEDEYGLWLETCDYKSAKKKYDDADDRIQSQVYQLALRHLYPQISRRTFHYLFLKFSKKPRLDVMPMTETQLDGLEWYLTDLQTAMESFTLDNAGDNLAAFSKDHQWLCGKPEGTKVDGSPKFCCEAHRPLDYWVIVDADGDAVIGGFTREELEPKLKEGQRLEEKSYPGCTAWWQDGRRRNFR